MCIRVKFTVRGGLSIQGIFTGEITKNLHILYQNPIAFIGSCCFRHFFSCSHCNTEYSVLYSSWQISLQKWTYFCNTGLCQRITNGNSEGVSQSCRVLTLCVSFLLQLVTHTLMAYLSRLSAIACNKINCGPALTWMEVRNEALVVLCSLTLASRVSHRCDLLPFKRCKPPRCITGMRS